MRKVQVDLAQSKLVVDALEFGDMIFVVLAPSSLHKAFAIKNRDLGRIAFNGSQT